MSAVVFVTLASTGGNPTDRRAGYEISEAIPAVDASNPAPKPATIRNINVDIIGVPDPLSIK
jgi:hypothetical protein